MESLGTGGRGAAGLNEVMAWQPRIFSMLTQGRCCHHDSLHVEGLGFRAVTMIPSRRISRDVSQDAWNHERFVWNAFLIVSYRSSQCDSASL